MEEDNVEKLLELQNLEVLLQPRELVSIGNEDPLEDALDILNMPVIILEENSGRTELELENNPQAANNNNIIPDKIRTNTRKKLLNKYEWKSSTRKRNHQEGKEYISSRKKLVPEKKIKDKKNCASLCRFKCSTKISHQQRKSLFDSYYRLDQNGKYHFINKTTERVLTSRPKNIDRDEESRRRYSFKYYFWINNVKQQVCKTFYLTTLDISQKPVYNVHAKKNRCTGVPQIDMRGQHKKKHVSEDALQNVRDHINSFPAIDSHYCRSRTKKKYLESHLSINKMYNLYVTKCETDCKEPVKTSMYRKIFSTEFNLDFHHPKSDRCAKCEEYTVSVRENITLSEIEKAKYEEHIKEKNKMREIKEKDKRNTEVPLLCFDLQNVITCPRAEISPLFYFKKLNVYNLTAHFSKKVYCSLWHEYCSGRSGNDLASAFIKILKRVAEDNEITNIITWSDSCVPQNRNSHLAYAILDFLRNHPSINSVTLKYSIPGHSAIQEVDSAHSAIERALSKTEFHSPLGLLRILKTLNPKNPYTVLQMKPEDFKNYNECAQIMKFKNVPFASITELRFTQNLFEVQYKTSYSTEDDDYKTVSIKQRLSATIINLPRPKILPATSITNDKREHIVKMLKFMNVQDREFYKVLLKLTDEEMNKKEKEGPNENNSKPSTSEKARKRITTARNK